MFPDDLSDNDSDEDDDEVGVYIFNESEAHIFLKTKAAEKSCQTTTRKTKVYSN